MAERKPLVRIDGETKQLPDGDTIEGAGIAVGSIPEAPEDGKTYGRKDGDWAEITGGDAGNDGREVELQKSATHIQWRYVGDPTWNNLVALTDITGPAGADAVGAATYSTITLASGTGTVAVGKAALLIKLVATDQARIRFYGTAAARTADASRAANVAAPQGSGLLLEFIAVTALLGAPLTPGIIAANMDTSPTGVIYYNIQPVGGAMSVDLTFLKLEN